MKPLFARLHAGGWLGRFVEIVFATPLIVLLIGVIAVIQQITGDTIFIMQVSCAHIVIIFVVIPILIIFLFHGFQFLGFGIVPLELEPIILTKERVEHSESAVKVFGEWMELSPLGVFIYRTGRDSLGFLTLIVTNIIGIMTLMLMFLLSGALPA